MPATNTSKANILSSISVLWNRHQSKLTDAKKKIRSPSS